ncbi:Uma2 family endonuclease [Lusitaniella coriacea]|uniref:Uma2 family endonuclease n=1 Tax=Lusitaniella coriacea TaxID=1983105 RepID=UPI003CE68958
MTQSLDPTVLPPSFPDHTQLPDEDGTFVKNFQEHPQSILLTDSILPVLQRLHPDGQYAIGQDCGIYWRETDPPERGAEAPDWFYVAGVPPLLDGQFRRSYVLWREFIAPLIAIELASGDGSPERDRAPLSRTKGQKPGKFWVYEQIIRIPYYAIFIVSTGTLEVYHLVNGSYRLLPPNDRGHFVIEPMNVELGVWEGNYDNQKLRWLRWWDSEGNLLLIGNERVAIVEQEIQIERDRAQRAEQEIQTERDRAQRAEQEIQTERDRAQRAEQEIQTERDRAAQQQQEAISRLLRMGLTAEQVAEALSLEL